MTWTQKETMFLQELKSAEKTCVDRYIKFIEEACDGALKNLFQTLLKREQQHLDTVTKLIEGTVPEMSGGSQSSTPQMQSEENCGCESEGDDYKSDKFLCDDALASEKFASSLYNTSIFVFKDTNVRNILNHIQKEEQEHGEMIYNYMKPRGMYASA